MWKWIFAIAGYYLTHSFWGALLGFFVGQFFDNVRKENAEGEETTQRTTSRGQSSTRSYSSTNSYGYQNDARTMFLNSLLELSAHIIAADGKIMHSEMEMVRDFLRRSFGEQTMTVCNQRLLTIFQERKALSSNQCWQRVFTSCQNIRYAMNQETCLQLLAYLAEIAKADGKVTSEEIAELRHIATSLGLASSVVDQMLSLGGQTLEDAYKVLGITPDATDDEVRKAYRKMALQYHPDRVATLGDDIKESATKKFQEINDAKDRIFKARGL